jgi:hypothetical protein
MRIASRMAASWVKSTLGEVWDELGFLENKDGVVFTVDEARIP